MAVYRFRVIFEDNDEVYRDIDIKSSQTFHDLHTAILASINFEDNCDSSFFISDDMWRRGDEVALNPRNEEEVKGKKKIAPPKYMMKKCKMAVLIDDPHQKFIYIHDPEKLWTFSVELIKILPDDDKINYPKCSKTVGIAPLKVKTPIVLPDLIEEDDLELAELEEHHETEAYVHSVEGGVDEEDLATATIEEEETDEDIDIEDSLEEEEDDFGTAFGDGEESSLDEI